MNDPFLGDNIFIGDNSSILATRIYKNIYWYNILKKNQYSLLEYKTKNINQFILPSLLATTDLFPLQF